jgi:hypothetical protein
MQTFTVQQAQAALAAQQSNAQFSVQQIRDLLQNASVTFANVVFVTQQQNSAAHKNVIINKCTNANIILCSNIAAHVNVYANKVRKSALQYANNSIEDINNFDTSTASFTHTSCYSVVQNKKVATKFYLYAIFNNAQTVLLHNNTVVTAQYAQQFLTPSALAAQRARVIHNKTNNVTHNVVVRTIAISNLVSIRARKQILTLV